MVKISETVEKFMTDYGEEGFLNHREDVYSAIRAICFCTEFLQNLEDWGSRRAITLRKSYTEDEYWDEEFQAGYDYGLRREELGKLREALKTPESWIGEAIPLKNFLNQGILLMTEYSRNTETWMELMDAQMITDQYKDYRAVQEAVYVFGLFELMKFQEGINYHYFRRDFCESERLLNGIGDWIPEGELENYESFCRALLKELEQKRLDTMKRVLRKRDEGLEKVRNKISVLKDFSREMEKMGDEEFGEFVRNRISADSESEEEKWDSRMNHRAKINHSVWKLAELFIYGSEALKKRLFQNLSEEEKTVVMEQWMADYYPSAAEKLAERMRRMDEVRKWIMGESFAGIGYLDDNDLGL